MKKLAFAALTPLTLFATDYAFVDLDRPWEIDKNLHWHFEGDGRTVGKADFNHTAKESSLRYTDAHAFGYFSHYVSENNALSWQLGYTYMNLDWHKSHRITQKEYQLGIASIALISNSIERWRWVANLGMTVDPTTFNVAKSSVYYGLLWGRYAFKNGVGVHIGFFGHTGVHTTYMLPVLGFDWHFAKKWQLNAIFPFDMSLNYYMDKNWSLALAWASFGGPYRYPWRAHEGGEKEFHNAIVEVNANGIELDLNFKAGHHFSAGIGAGYNFGGWILVRNHKGHHGKYYDFESAPYAQANVEFTF